VVTTRVVPIVQSTAARLGTKLRLTVQHPHSLWHVKSISASGWKWLWLALVTCRAPCLPLGLRLWHPCLTRRSCRCGHGVRLVRTTLAGVELRRVVDLPA